MAATVQPFLAIFPESEEEKKGEIVTKKKNLREYCKKVEKIRSMK